MSDETAAAEKKYLTITAISSAVLGCIGVGFSFVAESQAVLLDGLFNLVYFIAGLFTLKVAQLVRRGDDQDFPFGYTAFEPLVNGLKGVLVLGVTMFAFIDALAALLAGGRSIDAGPAVTYGVIASTACWGLAALTHHAAKRTGSPLIRADAENWLVNGAISTAVLLAFVGVFAIQGTSLAFLSPYVDSSLVILVVVLSISVPIRMGWRSLMELLARAPQRDIVEQVRNTVESCTAELPVQELFVRVLQTGRLRLILAHVVLPSDYEVGRLAPLDEIRSQTWAQLKAHHADSILDMVFTADPSMGAPSSDPSGS